MFEWREHLNSICDAPLDIIEFGVLDQTHPALEFTHYWNSLNGGEMPDRAHFSPKDIPKLLRWLMMFRRETIDDQDDYFLYLQGSSAAELTHGSLQGQHLHDFTASSCFETRRNVMRHVLSTKQPAYANIKVGNSGSEFSSNVIVGAFPLSDGDKEPIVIMLPAPNSLELRMYL